MVVRYIAAFWNNTLHLSSLWKVQAVIQTRYLPCVEKKNQLDVTECFIALMICSTCFGHFCAHHQELETICVCVITAYGVQWLVAGCWVQVQGSRLCVRDEGCCSTELSNIPHPERIAGCSTESSNIPHPERIVSCPAPDLQQPATKASHIIGGNNTHIVKGI